MKNIQTFEEFLNESQLNENSLPKDAEQGIKDLAYSMPNHTKSDSDGKFTDEQIKKAIKKYSPSLSQLVRRGMEEEIISKVQEILNESVETEMINEDANLIISVLMLGQATVLAAVVMARAGYDTPDETLKEWWTKWKKDRRVNKILDKLNIDPEVQQFLSLPTNQQKGKWQKLIYDKLDKSELDLLTSISRDRVKKGKI